MLQEAPNPNIGVAFYNNLRRLLPHFCINEELLFKVIESNKLEISASGGVFTMFPKQFTANDVTMRPDILSNICEANRRRFQAFELYLNNNLVLCMANFHGNFKDQAGMQQDIKFLVAQKYVVGGDFNLLEMPDLGVTEAEAQTDAAMQFPYRTYDGIYDGTSAIKNRQKYHIHIANMTPRKYEQFATLPLELQARLIVMVGPDPKKSIVPDFTLATDVNFPKLLLKNTDTVAAHGIFGENIQIDVDRFKTVVDVLDGITINGVDFVTWVRANREMGDAVVFHLQRQYYARRKETAGALDFDLEFELARQDYVASMFTCLYNLFCKLTISLIASSKEVSATEVSPLKSALLNKNTG
jgi:hypothetical protein